MTWTRIFKGLLRWALRSGRSHLLRRMLGYLSTSKWVGSPGRVRALGIAGLSIERSARVGSNLQFDSDNVIVGRNCVVGDNVSFLGLARIELENQTVVAGSTVGRVTVSTGGSGLEIHHPIMSVDGVQRNLGPITDVSHGST
jgi:acetyltransferase-like isoleucine patch superfamily enzyme